MTLLLTPDAEAALQRPDKQPQLILEIDGFPYFSAEVMGVTARYGDPGLEYGDPGVVYGGIRPLTAEENLPLIIIDGTTKKMKQQIRSDKGGSSSVTTVSIRLLDQGDILTEEFNKVEMLARDATFYIGFQKTRHPEDSIAVLVGTVSSIAYGAGYVDVKLSSSEESKRRDIFVETTTVLDGAIDSSQTSLTVAIDIDELLYYPTTNFKTYVKIEDEVIEYTSASGSTITGLTRGALGTIAAAHDDETELITLYRLQGNMIPLVLQLYLSTGDTSDTYLTDLTVNQVGGTPDEAIDNAVYFSGKSIQALYNIVVGDTVTLETSVQTVTGLVASIVQVETGSYLVMDQTLAVEVVPTGTCKFISQYNVLPDGCALGNQQVDINQFLALEETFSSSFPSFDIYLKETKEAKALIDEEILLVSNCNSIPRKGKISITAKNPPLAVEGLLEINDTNVLNPSALKTGRSTTNNLYNTVVYKYDEKPTENRFARGTIFVSNESKQRIKVGTKTFTIEGGGVRAGNEAVIDIISSKLLNRYKNAAETIDIAMSYRDGFPIEIGDIVLFNGESLRVVDTTNGSRDYTPRLMEVINKDLGFIDGNVQLTIQDTAFGINANYGIVSPSSVVASYASDRVVLSGFESDRAFDTQSDKWSGLIGATVLFHDTSWTYEYTATITGLDPANDNALLLSGLTGTPSVGDTMDLAAYTEQELGLKRVYVFLSTIASITSGTSGLAFNVSDVSDMYVGMNVRVHSSSYSNYSVAVGVTDITGNTITVDTDLGFTPSSGDIVTLYNFNSDERDVYNYI